MSVCVCVAANIPRRHRTGRWANQTTAKGGSVARVLLPGCRLAMPLCPGGCYFSSFSSSCSCSSVSCSLSIKINESFRCVAGVQILERASPRRFQLAENQFIRFPTWYRGACLKLKNKSSINSNNFTIYNTLHLLTPLQGPVIENISQRCGGFLKSLSLRGCQSVGDQSIKWVLCSTDSLLIWLTTISRVSAFPEL